MTSKEALAAIERILVAELGERYKDVSYLSVMDSCYSFASHKDKAGTFHCSITLKNQPCSCGDNTFATANYKSFRELVAKFESVEIGKLLTRMGIFEPAYDPSLWLGVGEAVPA